MEINVESEENIYTVTVGGKPVTTTWIRSDLELKRWIKDIHIIYGKRNRQDILVALCADPYQSRSGSHAKSCRGSGIEKFHFQLLQLCVGRHCLICFLGYELCLNFKPLIDFFYDRHVTVVGIGIDKTAELLEKQNGFLMPKRIELRDLAAKTNKTVEGHDFSRYNVQKLAKVVLGEEGNYEKPTKIQRHDNRTWTLSDDKIKYATAETFLVYEMGMKLQNELK